MVFFSLNQNGERERGRSVIRNPHWERTSDTLEKVKKRDRWMERERESQRESGDRTFFPVEF